MLRDECIYQPSEEMLNNFLASMTQIHLHPKEILVMSGEVDPDIYVVKEGILSHSYMDGIREKVMFFSLPGTMTFSSHSYYFGLPSFYQVEACCETILLRMSKSRFDSMINESHEFCHWVLSMAHCQLFFFEKKQAIINGDAKERFMSLITNRPEIMEKVPLKTVASYLGITQSYLSRLKRNILKQSAKEKFNTSI